MRALPAFVAAGLAALACLAVWPAFGNPVEWTPDALYYQARMLELRGAEEAEALSLVFEGPLSSELRARDPLHTGNPEWVAYNEPFYERRVALPLVGAALYPATEDRTLLYLSLAGYVASIVALFGFLLLRFRLAVASAVSLAAIFLPALARHSSFPLTDSWGLALGIVAFGGAVLTLDRGLRWLPLWIAAIGLLAFTRDSTWIPILAVGWCAVRLRSGKAAWLFGSGVAAALPAVLFFETPVRKLLALLVNGSDVPADTSWAFVVSHYPGAVADLVRANGGFLRDGEWYTGLYLVGGVLLLLAAWLRAREQRSAATTLMGAGAVVSLLYVLSAPVFSAFRLELVFVPMAAFGIASFTEIMRAPLSRLVGRSDRLRASAGELPASQRVAG